MEWLLREESKWCSPDVNTIACMGKVMSMRFMSWLNLFVIDPVSVLRKNSYGAL